jgi:hypothetical protein
MSIFLCIMDETEKEYHIKWEGHKTTEGAKQELQSMTTLAIKVAMETGDKRHLPFNCYVYEADRPPYNLPEENINNDRIMRLLKRDFGPISV